MALKQLVRLCVLRVPFAPFALALLRADAREAGLDRGGASFETRASPAPQDEGLLMMPSKLAPHPDRERSAFVGRVQRRVTRRFPGHGLAGCAALHPPYRFERVTSGGRRRL